MWPDPCLSACSKTICHTFTARNSGLRRRGFGRTRPSVTHNDRVICYRHEVGFSENTRKIPINDNS